MEAAGCGDSIVCSGVCWFICGRLGVALADCHSVVFALANVAGQVRQCGEWHDLPHRLVVVCCILGKKPLVLRTVDCR